MTLGRTVEDHWGQRGTVEGGDRRRGMAAVMSHDAVFPCSIV